MTGITLPQRSTATRVERLLLRAADALEHVVQARLDNRAARRELGLVRAQSTAETARRDAQACGSVGTLSA